MLKKSGEIAKQFKRELKVYRLAMKDPRTPKKARWLLGFAAAYFLSPIDLIPDFIPILGQLDDLIIVPLVVTAALRMIPTEVIRDCRVKAGFPETSDGGGSPGTIREK